MFKHLFTSIRHQAYQRMSKRINIIRSSNCVEMRHIGMYLTKFQFEYKTTYVSNNYNIRSFHFWQFQPNIMINFYWILLIDLLGVTYAIGGDGNPDTGNFHIQTIFKIYFCFF